MLQIKNLKSGYEKLEVLKNINLSVGNKEIVSIIGPNGSGKSTFLKSVFNLCDVYEGDILFDNKNIRRLPTYKLISKGISYVPQGRQIFSNLSVRENLEMGGFVINNKEIVEKRLKKIFQQFPFLEKKQNDYAFNLSGGQQQILAIARALMQNPKFILLDEPSLGLSPKAIKDIFAIIKKINNNGVSIILVEQNVKYALNISNRVYVLENGKVAFSGVSDELKKTKLKEIYFGE